MSIISKTLRTKSSNNRIIGFVMILGLFVLSMSGCQQVNDVVNSNKATNSNATANTNANSNANSNVTANSDANANTSSVVPSNSAANVNNQTSNTAANTATAPKEEVSLTEEAKAFAFSLTGKWKMANQATEVTFAEDGKYEVKYGNQFRDKGSYRVLNETTVEINSVQLNKKWNATMKIMNNGKTLDWQQPGEKFVLTRVEPN